MKKNKTKTDILDTLNELDKLFKLKSPSYNLSQNTMGNKYLSILCHPGHCEIKSNKDFFYNFWNNFPHLDDKNKEASYWYEKNFKQYCSQNVDIINQHNDYGLSPLHHAIIQEDLTAVKILIEYGANIYQDIVCPPHIEMDVLFIEKNLNALQLAQIIYKYKLIIPQRSQFSSDEIVNYLYIIDEKKKLENLIM